MKQEDILNEKKEKLELPKLKYSESALRPMLSEQNVKFHYGALTKGYFEKYNKTNDSFQYAGAFLHTIWWDQFTPKFSKPVRPNTQSLIKKHFKSVDKFKKAMEDAAKEFHGSGWIYLSKNGSIKTIKNHEVKKDIIILIDLWEHSYQHDYGSDKAKYIENIWKILDWDVIETRVNGL